MELFLTGVSVGVLLMLGAFFYADRQIARSAKRIVRKLQANREAK